MQRLTIPASSFPNCSTLNLEHVAALFWASGAMHATLVLLANKIHMCQCVLPVQQLPMYHTCDYLIGSTYKSQAHLGCDKVHKEYHI